jgi:hypothetical protein
LNQTVAQSPSKLTEGFPLYETIERNCQHILDAQYPVYSEFFGRNENMYDSVGNQYSVENQLRFAHIQTGMNLRGQSLTDATGSLPVKFNDLFKTIKSIWNVGYAFELINSLLRLRIEEYSYFFDGSGDPSLDLSGRISKYDIVSIVMPELVPVEISSGFNDYEYLQLNGRAEPNTTNKRTSKINTDTKLDNISEYRGDTKGILTALATPLDTTDTNLDNGVYIIKTQRDGARWKPEKDKNITIVDDTSVFKEDQLNRYFTPSRMLIRQGNRITSGFTTSDLKASKFIFQTSDKLQTLKTTGEGYTIAENDDILISNLPNPIYKPIKHTVECSFDYQDLEAIKALPYRWIKFSETISGYLLNLKKKNNEAKAEITIIQRYVS